MVKLLGLFSMRVDNPIEVRFTKGEPQVRGKWYGMCRSGAGRGRGKWWKMCR